MARIRIYISRHLCTAPRPQKEAEALAAAGHDVSIHGVAYRAELARRDEAIAAGRAWRWEPVADFTPPGRAPAWLFARVRHRLGRQWYGLTGRVTGDVWGYAQGALAAHARRNPADLTVVHSEGGLAIGLDLLRRGHRVGVDFEDWFSRDLTVDQQRHRPVARLEEMERVLLRGTAYATTTSHAMAERMAATLGGPVPAVIYNTFPCGPEPAPPAAWVASRPVALHWFSQIIGPDRGLETLMAALPGLAPDWRLHLRGEVDPAYARRLVAGLPPALADRVQFHPTVAPAELPAALAQFDLGLALEDSSSPNKRLTIANKFFHYLQAGLAIVASDTEGHREGLALAPGAGEVFRAGDPGSLGAAIDRMVGDRARLAAARRAARAEFVQSLCQEKQAGVYSELAARELAHR
ncbi:MAG TPA: glycosyltransferase [Candidatus Limnocylindria bacterium]|jgi:glycosyltransferase involved in cell wall biosynthesis|nr:glycosyltransferase [Candidatus Limnocylindria bacterium]HTL66475.1 glycosyltransferase [Lacunisphaera sp.]